MRKSSSSSGYTLVELLIALALMSVVMLAITSAINLMYRTRTISEHQVLHSQLCHRLFTLFEKDLRHVIVPANSEETELTAEDELAALLGTLTGEDLGTDLVEAEEVALYASMMGTSTHLSLWVEQPLPTNVSTLVADPDLAEMAQSIAAEGGRGQMITWGLTAAEELPAPGLLPGNTMTAIRQIDLTTPNGELQPLVANDAYEIVECAFSYWDGSSWLTEWNSEDQVSPLPIAIEMTVQTAEEVDSDNSFSNTQTNLKTWQRIFLTRDMSQSSQLAEIEETVE